MQSDPSPLLGPNDPAPFRWINREPQKRFLLLNDHAGFHTPESLGDLGLSAEHWTKHIVGDWGMEALGRDLVQRLAHELELVVLLGELDQLVYLHLDGLAPSGVTKMGRGTWHPVSTTALQRIA